VIDHPDAVDYRKEPNPHVSVHWCYGVQQGIEQLKGACFEDVISLINDASK
jgi:hypothetical protein